MSHGSSQWGSGGLGRGGIATVQSPSGASGYVNQRYGYGGYGGNDGAYVDYGAIGAHSGSGPNGNASAGEGQAGAGGYDASGNIGYENLGWQSEPIQGSANFGQQSSGPNDGQVGYGSAPARPGQQQ